MITVSITRLSSNANWSCERMPSFLGRETSPLVGSISPVSIFISVDLPAPLGPVIPYRRPSKKVVDTSANKTRGPKRIVTLLIESIAYVLYRNSQEFRSTRKRELHEDAALRMKTILRGPGGNARNFGGDGAAAGPGFQYHAGVLDQSAGAVRSVRFAAGSGEEN